MATLTNPIEESNLASRFEDYVVADANASIVWGTNANPTYTDGTVVVPDSVFGGTTSGRSSTITGTSIKNGSNIITAANITSAVRAETAAYLSIRKLQARLNVTGPGGNSGTRPTAGIVYDETSKAYLSSTYLGTLGTVSGEPVANTPVSVTGLQTYFSNLRTRYRAVRDDTQVYTRDVCHSSCHSSCHGSRGRR